MSIPFEGDGKRFRCDDTLSIHKLETAAPALLELALQLALCCCLLLAQPVALCQQVVAARLGRTWEQQQQRHGHNTVAS